MGLRGIQGKSAEVLECSGVQGFEGSGVGEFKSLGVIGSLECQNLFWQDYIVQLSFIVIRLSFDSHLIVGS